MRLAIVSTMAATPWGGSEELWAATAEAALAENHQVYLGVYHWSALPARIALLQQQGAIVSQRGRWERTRQMSKLAKVRSLLAEEFNKFNPWFKDLIAFQPDVVCISQGATYDAIWLIPDLIQFLYQQEIPYIVVCQANSDDFILNESDRHQARKFFDHARRIVFVAQQNLNTAEKQLATSLPHALVNQNPVNLTDISPVPWTGQEVSQLACVSRLHIASKGQDLLLEALADPIWRQRSWKLKLYGEGVDRAYLQSLVQYHQLNDRVEFCGYVSDVRQIWAENHLLVIASRSEGTPLALVEAMLCARPAIVTDVGGNTAWVEDSKTGFVAAAPTAHLLRAALETAWNFQAQWQNMGSLAHAVAIQKLDKTPEITLLRLIQSSLEPIQ
jgi:glycosyltransferase involved in cell wall biosynthesis